MDDYEREQNRLRAILAEMDSDDDDNVNEQADNSEIEDLEIMSEHNSETDQDGDSDSIECDENNDVLLGKDGSFWRKSPYKTARANPVNIFQTSPALTKFSSHVRTPIESFEIFFSFTNHIVECTNIFIKQQQPKYKYDKNATATDNIEINALFGLLYLAGLHKSSHVHVRDLWATDGTGLEIFAATMSYNRFEFLIRCIRFDNVETRLARREVDKLAPIRDIFQIFNQNCLQNYNVGCFITVDEKLEGFRGRCSFRQYIPSKPAKYGIKIFSVVDSVSFYTSQLEVYCGKQPPGHYNLCNKPDQIVLRLTKHLQNAGRNLTVDNWFTSHYLAKELLQNRTTIVGTIRKNKRILPPSFSITKKK